MPAIFLTDVLVTVVAAWLLACASGHGRQNILEAGLAWCWSVVALVAGAGVILGITGGFGPVGFLVFHSVLLGILLVLRRQQLAADREALRAVGRQARDFFRTPGSERWIGAGLLLLLAMLTVIAAFAQPAVLDALTYHLPRIGAWLQDGRVHMLGTSDLRLNFVTDIPDITWAWLVGGTPDGFHLAVLAQVFTGIMAVGATVGLARMSGLGRGPALLTGGLLLGMANVIAQFTSAQTDVFAAGVLAASFYLWLIALRRGEFSWLGTLGAGLALGAKGTLFYLAPTALLWVAWLAWHYRLPKAQWWRTLLGGALGITLFALPSFARNWQTYGGFLGPAPWVKKHHQGFDSVAGQLHKLDWNLASTLAQNSDPQSQPEPLRAISLRTAQALVGHLPARDPYTLHGLDRRATLESILQRTVPDADAVGFGNVAVLLFALGTVMCLARGRNEGADLTRLWSTGVVIFLLFFHFMQQWHPYALRYFVLVAPWIALVAGWGIAQLAPPWRSAVWLLAAFATLDVGWSVTVHTHQAGWKSIASPGRSQGYFVAQGWRNWSQALDHPEAPYVLALPEERPIAAFYRQSPRREVQFQPEPENGTVTAEQLLQGKSGWLIVSAARLLGREGRVAASVWLYEGDENSSFSLAAYRALEPGEKPSPILYRQKGAVTGGVITYNLLVKTTDQAVVHLMLANPGAHDRGFQWSTPLGRGRAVLPAGVRLGFELPMPVDAVGEIAIAFDPANPAETKTAPPTVELQR